MSILSERRDTLGSGMGDIERDLRSFISENFILDGQQLAGDASLTLNGVLDSMGILELIMFLEERFKVSVPDEDTLPENLDSVDRIVQYVQARLAEEGG
jgi:acyl carrier protein